MKTRRTLSLAQLRERLAKAGFANPHWHAWTTATRGCLELRSAFIDQHPKLPVAPMLMPFHSGLPAHFLPVGYPHCPTLISFSRS